MLKLKNLSLKISPNLSLNQLRYFLTAKFPELKEFPKSIQSYQDLHKYSVDNSDHFWGTLAKNRLEWYEPFEKVNNNAKFSDLNKYNAQWFLNGKLNVSVNCVDRHYLKNPNKVALIWEKDEPGTHETVTYEQLYKLMNKMANLLKSCGVQKGDRVAIYLPTCTMVVACMMACARIGAVHSVVFAGFSAESLASRINDSECKIVITANQSVRGGKTIDLKKTVDAAVKQSPTIKNVLVYKRTNNKFNRNPDKDIIIDEVLDELSPECAPEIMDANDPLFMLYTSGSTGKPKGLVHAQAGYILQTAFSHQIAFDYDQNDVFGCLADVGWITGHTYIVYAPLCNGGTTVLFESSPIYPNPSRYWETIQRLKINQLYIAPTSIRLLIKNGDEWLKNYDRSSLKLLGSVGEPINHEAWHWYYDVIGDKRCKIIDTWWQTETGSMMIAPLPCGQNDVIKPAMAMRPFFGIDAVLLDERGQERDLTNAEGILCIKKPWPSMARTIYGDHQRFIDTYLKPFPGYYFTGDGAQTDENRHFQITGRVDDVINVSGHRIGTAEVEDVLDESHHVSESAVVGFPHETLGEGIFAFITLRKNDVYNEDELINELKTLVKSKIAAYAVPHYFLIVSNLPKTRSGKIMRRILRKIASDKFNEMGDTSTLFDPSLLDEIVAKYKSLKGMQ
ncbi:unnamed protein product [Brachionus calyciflorus]|uniref:Acetyl-coenzyme A synthetase n=1 Tax=Brachionus calyciflorus TaxID=104777 RepID=A0A813S2R6_9BILA|nr:unnamed protein product [Brachionus calyciflorus]